MKDQINGLLDGLATLRKEVYGQPNTAEIHALLGRAMSNLMRAREIVEKQ